MIIFRKIDVFSSTSEDWRLFHAFRRVFHHENEPEEPILDDKTTEEYIKRDMITSGMEFSVYRIYDSNNVIGSFFYGIYDESSKSYLGNEKVVRFEIQLLKAYHHQGIATKFLQIMVEDCEKRGKTIFISEFQNSNYKPFFEAIGGVIVQTNNESKLILSEVDDSMIKSWISEAERINPETKMVVFENKIPESIEGEFARTFNEALQQIPRGNIESKPRVFDVESLRTMENANKLVGALSIIVVSVEKDGSVSGISNVRRNRGSEQFLNQGLTGVLKDYRGRKLGKWIKAKMILYLREHYPEIIAIGTGNAETNAPMLYINTKLGFKKYKESITGQIYLNNLKKYLNSKKIPLFQINSI